MPFLHTQKSCCSTLHTIVEECVLRLSKKKAEINAHRIPNFAQEKHFSNGLDLTQSGTFSVVDNINGLVETNPRQDERFILLRNSPKFP